MKEIVSIHSDQIASYRQTAKEDPKDGDQNEAVQGDVAELDSNEDKQLVEPTKPSELKGEKKPKGIFGFTEKEIKAKLRLYEGRKANNNKGKDEKKDKEGSEEEKANDGVLIKKEEDEPENEIQLDTFYKLYEMFGGYKTLIQVGGVQLLNQLLEHNLRKMHTNWSKVKPNK